MDKACVGPSRPTRTPRSKSRLKRLREAVILLHAPSLYTARHGHSAAPSALSACCTALCRYRCFNGDKQGVSSKWRDPRLSFCCTPLSTLSRRFNEDADGAFSTMTVWPMATALSLWQVSQQGCRGSASKMTRVQHKDSLAEWLQRAGLIDL